MPTRNNHDPPMQATGKNTQPIANSTPSCPAKSLRSSTDEPASPSGTKALGQLLIDLRTAQLLAADSLAQNRFSISTPGQSPGQSPESLSLENLRKLFPQLTAPQWTRLVDPSNKNTRDVSTSLELAEGDEQTDGDELAIRVVATPLNSVGQELLLLTLEAAANGPEGIVHCDALTGLPDRRELTAQIQRWQHQAQSQQQAQPHQHISYAVLFLDLDQFKKINDEQGHAVGDQILRTLAKRWQTCVRDGDLVVRYGGDEIVILLKGITNRADVEPVLTRLTEATLQPLAAGEQSLQVGVTIGVAVSSTKTDQLEELINIADRDMYAVKRQKNG